MGLQLERTTDVAYIRSILNDPDCVGRFRDDYTGHDIEPQIGENLIYLRPKDGGAVLLFHPYNLSMWFVHAAVLKKEREKSQDIASLGAKWMATNTPCRCIVAVVATGNYPAMRLIESIGFKVTGILPKSVLVNGSLIDQRVYALEV